MKRHSMRREAYVGPSFFILLFVFINLTLPTQKAAYGAEIGSGWKAPEDSASLKNPLPSDTNSIEAGKTVYEQNCLSCHGDTGRGDGSMASYLAVHPTDLSNGELIDPQTDGELFWKITNGKTPMPNWGDALSEEERWQVVNFLRTLPKKKK